ncbi:MAG TPA: TetR family transcriptional regulator [Chloroflexota bacterium]|nr:TetR family transcriptional regulator [Chloroflexota bacterium]
MTQADRSSVGLRERKKAKTRAAIQQQALRLFAEQGYDATTVEQIAAAAEVSPSTFFRYFPTKEDVALYDALDPLIIAAFGAQPRELGPIDALRRAMREVFAALSPAELNDLQRRFDLVREIPGLRARMLEEFSRTIMLMAEVLARRQGRPADDFAVRTFAGAIVGVGMAVLLAADEEPAVDFLALFDAGLAHLEAGLPL